MNEARLTYLESQLKKCKAEMWRHLKLAQAQFELKEAIEKKIKETNDHRREQEV